MIDGSMNYWTHEEDLDIRVVINAPSVDDAQVFASDISINGDFRIASEMEIVEAAASSTMWHYLDVVDFSTGEITEFNESRPHG